MNPTVDGREAFLKKAAEVYDRIVGRAGPDSGESFDQIEERVEAAGREVQRMLLARRLAGEAQAEPATVPCPQCGQPMRRPAASGIVESTVKQVGQRVKGSEKHWGMPGVLCNSRSQS